MAYAATGVAGAAVSAPGPKTGCSEIVSSGTTSCRRLARQGKKQEITRTIPTTIGPTALSSPKISMIPKTMPRSGPPSGGSGSTR